MKNFYFLRACVTGNVNLGDCVVENSHSSSEQLVYNVSDELFVARYCGSGNYHKVGGTQLDFIVHTEGHSVKRGHRLALTAR